MVQKEKQPVGDQLRPFMMGDDNTDHLSRKERRKRAAMNSRVAQATNITANTLSPIDNILNSENELALLLREQQNYQKAIASDRILLDGCKIFLKAGISSEQVRSLMVDPGSSSGILTTAIRDGDPNVYQAYRGRQNEIWAHMTKGKVLFVDEDDELFLELMKEGELEPLDLLAEHVRSRTEALALIGMQIEWLREQNRQKRKGKKVEHQALQKAKTQKAQVKVNPVLVTEPSLETSPLSKPEIQLPEVSENFLLSDWELFWTKRFFSDDPNHLVPIPTQNRASTVQALSELSRGQVSIRTASIVSSLEFHLRKDKLQRALASRMRYGPEGIKDWIKLKRGKDRILMLIPDTKTPRAIFFAANRDVVYTGVQ